MRRLTAATAAVACLATSMVLAGTTAAGAQTTEPTEEPGNAEIPAPEPGTEVCTITDYRLVGLSGLVATDDGYIVINDGSVIYDEQLPIFFLDQTCQVVDFQAFWPNRPYDPEDMVLDHERQLLWVADIGDNAATSGDEVNARGTVALWQVDLSGGDRTPVIYRFRYPDGPRDAEALLLDGDGTPIIVTKTVGAAELFMPAGALVPDNPAEQAVPLEKVGEVNLPQTDSEHEFLPSAAASRAITGGTVAPDGSRVALRTYTDAFEFDVPDGDVVAAVTEGEPRITPLPGEPFGEAITYTPDGEQFLTVSDLASLNEAEIPTVILSYIPTPPAPPAPEPTQAAANEPGGGGFSLFNNVQDIINLIAVVGIVGLLLVVAGVVGIVRARRRWRSDDGEQAADSQEPVTGRARLTGEGAGERPAAGAAGVYTSRAARGAAEPVGGSDGYPSDDYGSGYEAGEPGAGVGSSAGGTYQGGTYRAGGHHGGQMDEYDDQGGGYPDQGYQQPGYGEEYASDGRYGHQADPYTRGTPDQPFDQDWHQAEAERAGYAYHQQGGYQQDGYYQDGYYQGGYQQGGYQQGGYPQHDGYPAHADGQRHWPADGGQPEGAYDQGTPDYYSDDPDYPYEFRGR